MAVNPLYAYLSDEVGAAATVDLMTGVASAQSSIVNASVSVRDVSGIDWQ